MYGMYARVYVRVCCGFRNRIEISERTRRQLRRPAFRWGLRTWLDSREVAGMGGGMDGWSSGGWGAYSFTHAQLRAFVRVGFFDTGGPENWVHFFLHANSTHRAKTCKLQLYLLVHSVPAFAPSLGIE